MGIDELKNGAPETWFLLVHAEGGSIDEIIEAGGQAGYRVYPTCYKAPAPGSLDMPLAQARNDAACALFRKWTERGYNKYHAKSPYGCKEFQAFLDQEDYLLADCLLIKE